MPSVMKLPLALLPLSSGLLLGLIMAQPGNAQCVQADVGVQYNVSGSRVPTRRRNDVRFEGEGRCVGNTSVTTGVQGNVGGTAPLTQRRQVRQRIIGEPQRGRRGRRGRDRDIIRIRVNPTIDVYNPADRLR